MSLTRRVLLGGLAAAGVAAKAAPLRPRRLVYVFANGGWDPSFALDPKEDRERVDGPWLHADPLDPLDVDSIWQVGDYAVGINPVRRPSVGQFFANYGDRASLVRGIWTGTIAHDTSRVRVLTGTADTRNADVATRVGAALGVDTPLGSVDLSGLSYVGTHGASTGQIGAQSQVIPLVDRSRPFPTPAGVVRPSWTPTDPDAIEAFVQQRTVDFHNRVRDLGGANHIKVMQRFEALDRGLRFGTAAKSLLASLTPGAHPDFAAQAGLAVDLLAADTCRAVFLDTSLHWDSHDDNAVQDALHEETFAGLYLLVSGLEAAGLLEDTLVVAISEMGRAPRQNLVGGKDHWPHATALLVGAGFAAGRAFGATDDDLASLAVGPEGRPDAEGAPIRYDGLAAGLLTAMGLDAEAELPGVVPLDLDAA